MREDVGDAANKEGESVQTALALKERTGKEPQQRHKNEAGKHSEG